jgi:hypothetical protein
MRIRPTLCGVTAAGLLAVGAAAETASAARVYGGQPSEPQSQAQLVLSLSNDGRKLTKVTFHVNAACTEDFTPLDFGTPIMVDQAPEMVRDGEHYLIGGRIANGRISGRIFGADTIGDATIADFMTLTLAGTVGRTRASGRMQVLYVRRNLMTGDVVAQCSKNVAWRSIRAPGRVYAGATSQGEPIVIELTSDRKRVDHAHLGWYANCTQGGFVEFAHDEFDLRSFALSRTGAFQQRYATSFSDGTLVQRFRGRVGATRASGTYQGTFTAVGQATSDTCASGAVSWSAATG